MSSDKSLSKPKRKRHRVGADGLTARERKFVHAYSVTLVEDGKGNQTKAAIAAGFPEKSAAVRASQFMKRPQVKEAITKLMDESVKKFDISRDKVLQEIAALGFSNMTNYLTFGEDGSCVIDFSKAAEHPEIAAAIQEVIVDEYMERTGETDDDGKPTFERVKRVRFKLHDKKGSLELLGRHHKLFTDNVAVGNPDGTPLQPTVLNVNFIDSDGDGRPAK